MLSISTATGRADVQTLPALAPPSDLLRRLDPKHISQHLNGICTLVPELTEDLLASIDQPLETRRCKKTGRDYLLCDYNRDGDSYRSPWSNQFDPPLSDGTVPSERVRKMEERANEAFDIYRELYVLLVPVFRHGAGSGSGFRRHTVLTNIAAWQQLLRRWRVERVPMGPRCWLRRRGSAAKRFVGAVIYRTQRFYPFPTPLLR